MMCEATEKSGLDSLYVCDFWMFIGLWCSHLWHCHFDIQTGYRHFNMNKQIFEYLGFDV